MGRTDPDIDRCHFCGRTAQGPSEDTTASRFCSPGCRAVATTLGGAREPANVDGRDRTDGDERDERSTEATSGHEQLFFTVDGMHSTTCEAFLESRAEARAGVAAATASYVSETVQITYDPDQVSSQELGEALSTAGYTAVPRAEAPIDPNAARDHSQRQFDSVLGYRYAIGVLFGSFVMLTYVVLLYPVHLSSLLGAGALGLFARGVDFGGDGGLLILPVYLVLTGVVLFFTGMPLLRGAYVSLKTRRPTTELLVALTIIGAYLYSTVAFLHGRPDVYYDLTIVVAAGVVAAIFYESLIKQRAMDRLTELTVSQIDEATLSEADGTTRTVPVEELVAGDRILVRDGERVPVDGVLAEGECTVDEAVVTGESLPVEKRAGDEIVGGSVVTEGAAIIAVGERTASRIDRLVSTVWDLQSADHGVQRRADRIAGKIIPAVLVLALLAGGSQVVLGRGPISAATTSLLAVVVTSPWALGLATPLSVATSLSEALDRGLVVFDETIFERLREMDVVVFDKTGTLTIGEMTVVDADAPADLLRAAGRLEQRASHPAAAAIAAEFAPEGTGTRTDGGLNPEPDDTPEPGSDVREFRTHGSGVEGVMDGTEVLVGHPDLFAERGWEIGDVLSRRVAEARGFGRLPVVLGRDGRAEGLVVLGDTPRAQWNETVTRLGEDDTEVIVLTGDDEDAAAFFRDHPHVEHVFANVPPAGKTAAIERLQADRSVTMVGDGTNDAPALARADLGISLGSGTAIAADAADVTITTDDLTAVPTAFDLARAARRRVVRNTGIALLYNGITIPIALAGLLNPLFVFAAVLASGGLLAANSARPLLDE